MRCFIILLTFVLSTLALALAHEYPPVQKPKPPPPPPATHPGTSPGGVIPGTPSGGPPGTCPQPTPEMLNCLRQWACQYVVRLDLRCLLNLNGNPLLGNLISIPGVTNGGSGGGSGGGGGILGGLLGGK